MLIFKIPFYMEKINGFGLCAEWISYLSKKESIQLLKLKKMSFYQNGFGFYKNKNNFKEEFINNIQSSLCDTVSLNSFIWKFLRLNDSIYFA